MTITERDKHTEDLFSECLSILHGKGTAYSGTEDANSNFKRNAERLGATKYQVLMIYLNKHYDGIMNAIRKQPAAPVETTEGMHGRIVDTINYLVILDSLLKEDEKWEEHPEQKTNLSPTKWTGKLVSPKLKNISGSLQPM
jgi:hypothetical protein